MTDGPDGLQLGDRLTLRFHCPGFTCRKSSECGVLVDICSHLQKNDDMFPRPSPFSFNFVLLPSNRDETTAADREL